MSSSSLSLATPISFNFSCIHLILHLHHHLLFHHLLLQHRLHRHLVSVDVFLRSFYQSSIGGIVRSATHTYVLTGKGWGLRERIPQHSWLREWVLSFCSPALLVLFCLVSVSDYINLSYHAICYLDFNWRVLFHLTSVLSCSVLFCPVLLCSVLSCPVLSCPVLSCPVLSCPVLSCPVLSCPVLYCSVLFFPVLLDADAVTLHLISSSYPLALLSFPSPFCPVYRWMFSSSYLLWIWIQRTNKVTSLPFFDSLWQM